MIVEGTGRFVAAGDGDALRNAIEPYLADPALAQRDGENALEYVRDAFPLEKKLQQSAQFTSESSAANSPFKTKERSRMNATALIFILRIILRKAGSHFGRHALIH